MHDTLPLAAAADTLVLAGTPPPPAMASSTATATTPTTLDPTDLLALDSDSDTVEENDEDVTEESTAEDFDEEVDPFLFLDDDNLNYSNNSGTANDSDDSDRHADPHQFRDSQAVVSDFALISGIMYHIFQTHSNDPLPGTSLNVASTCSSLGSTYAYIVPRLLYHHILLARQDTTNPFTQQITANIVHVIPQHKTVKAEPEEEISPAAAAAAAAAAGTAAYTAAYTAGAGAGAGARGSASRSTSSTSSRPAGVYNIRMSGSTFSISPRDPNLSQSAMDALLRAKPDMSISSSVYTPPATRRHHHPVAPIPTATVGAAATAGGILPSSLDMLKPKTFAKTAAETAAAVAAMSPPVLVTAGPVPLPLLASPISPTGGGPLTAAIANTIAAVASADPAEPRDPIALQTHSFASPIPTAAISRITNSVHPHDLDNYIFNSFAFLPRRSSTLVVPPNSADYNFALYPLISHVLPPFADIITTRFAETKPGGLMVIAYPTSLKLYHDYILKCVDLALHQMLALNMLSTLACEAVSVPPPVKIPSFETQQAMIHKLPGADIAYARKIERYHPIDWGYRWVSEDMNWIRKTLSAHEVSSQSVAKFINLLTLNPLCSSPSDSDISLFIVRKRK